MDFFFFFSNHHFYTGSYLYTTITRCGRLRGNNSPLRLRLGRSIDIFYAEALDTQSLPPNGRIGLWTRGREKKNKLKGCAGLLGTALVPPAGEAKKGNHKRKIAEPILRGVELRS